jgi:membrane protein YdbS with pleckstrin-like domain
MADMEIRPTMKFIVMGYAFTGVLLAAAVIWWAVQKDNVSLSLGAVVVAALLSLWPVMRHLERQRVVCRVAGGQLRYSYGLLSSTVKTIPVANIQDVTVHQSLMQRMWGVGDLRIESAGRSSALEIDNVDGPNECVEKILAARAGGVGEA